MATQLRRHSYKKTLDIPSNIKGMPPQCLDLYQFSVAAARLAAGATPPKPPPRPPAPSAAAIASFSLEANLGPAPVAALRIVANGVARAHADPLRDRAVRLHLRGERLLDAHRLVGRPVDKHGRGLNT